MQSHSNIGQKFGIKVHGMYHILEFCKAKRYPPGDHDDQRVEAWNQWVAKYTPLFECFGGKTNLCKMINKLWRLFVMEWNETNTNFVWNGEQLI